MHEVKGMSRLVQAFAVDATLAARANLVIVGGDLEQPTAAEAAELSRIKQLFDRHPGLDQRVILLGHRPNDEVSLVLAMARSGWGSHIGAGGAYACGSAKEEFGLAIIEAMAAGLPVVAPQQGGPATYVEDGVTGRLVDTSDIGALAAAIGSALDLSTDPSVAARTRSVVEARFTLERMARTLAAIYRISAGASTLALAVRGAEQHTT
jgi:glycosyltransferase involved in cell wall biosynthesis